MARFLASTAFILALLVSQSYSQVRIGVAQAPKVEPWKAASASLILPGLGQTLLDQDESAQWFFLSEVSFWVTLGGAFSAKEHYLSTALDHAGRYASATSAPRDEEFLQLIGEYQSRSGSAGHNSSPDIGEDYNQDLIRSGLDVDYRYPNTQEYSWDWGSSDEAENNQRRNQYNSLLRKYRLSKIIYQTSIGLLLLNRVVSSIHALRSAQNQKVQTSQSSSGMFININSDHVFLSWRKSF